eukprot:scaffold6616_cov153-Pinguiococcus_pyrenoidosus.AAC.1
MNSALRVIQSTWLGVLWLAALSGIGIEATTYEVDPTTPATFSGDFSDANFGAELGFSSANGANHLVASAPYVRWDEPLASGTSCQKTASDERESGYVKVFDVNSSGSLHDMQQIMPTDSTPYNHDCSEFGSGVAIVSKRHLAVGAQRMRRSDNRTTGGVFLYHWDTGSEQFVLTSDSPVGAQPDLGTNINNKPDDGASLFGNDVALWGDTVVVPAYFEKGRDNSSLRIGAVYTARFESVGDFWKDWTFVPQPDEVAYSTKSLVHFGFGVALWNLDLVVTALKLNDDKGSVYFYTRSTTSASDWTLQTTFEPEANKTGFGFSVAMHDTTVMVGANEADNKKGRVHVYEKNGTDWHSFTTLQPTDLVADDRFGEEVSLDENVAVILARKKKRNTDEVGAIYVYTKVGNEWQQASNSVISQDAVSSDLLRSLAVVTYNSVDRLVVAGRPAHDASKGRIETQDLIAPSEMPTTAPSLKSSENPTARPTNMPSSTPSFTPSARPSGVPSFAPSARPSGVPSFAPSAR